jgi:hypothetical protein
VAEVSIEQWARRVGANLDESARAIKIAVFNDVIENTRVDTGRLRGNWQTSTAKPKTNTLERTDQNGSQSKAEVLATVKADTVDYLANNLPYAEVWEEKDGMIVRALARVEAIVRKQKG